MTQTNQSNVIKFPKSVKHPMERLPLVSMEDYLRNDPKPRIHLMRTFDVIISIPTENFRKETNNYSRLIMTIDRPQGNQLISVIIKSISRDKETTFVSIEVRCDRELNPIKVTEIIRKSMEKPEVTLQ